MRIVIAPNAFKNSLDAAAVAEAISKGLQQSKLDCETICFPVGDGGDGTGALLAAYFNAKKVITSVHDPLGRIIASSFDFINESKTAIIEMADASGLRLLQPEAYDFQCIVGIFPILSAQNRLISQWEYQPIP